MRFALWKLIDTESQREQKLNAALGPSNVNQNEAQVRDLLLERLVNCIGLAESFPTSPTNTRRASTLHPSDSAEVIPRRTVTGSPVNQSLRLTVACDTLPCDLILTRSCWHERIGLSAAPKPHKTPSPLCADLPSRTPQPA